VNLGEIIYEPCFMVPDDSYYHWRYKGQESTLCGRQADDTRRPQESEVTLLRCQVCTDIQENETDRSLDAYAGRTHHG